MSRNIGIILAGGVGRRFGATCPKQYCKVLGKEMLWYSINAFQRSEKLDDFIVIVDDAEMNRGRIAGEYGVKTVCGGATRNLSLKNALEYIHAHYPYCEKIIENNAACPMITPELIDVFMDKLDEYDYVHTTYKITDALGACDGSVVDRDDFFLIQAPDAYRFPLLYKYFDPESDLCHPAHQLPHTAKECRYYDYVDNFKVTHPQDIEIVEILLKRRQNKKMHDGSVCGG